MKKYLPFVFPAVAVLLVLFLAFRWYSLRTTDQAGPDFASDVEVEDITGESMTEVNGVGDFETVELMPTDPAMADQTAAMGQIRYELSDDGQVRMTVQSALPQLDAGQRYQVWLKEVDGQGLRKAVVLHPNKGGYLGSASFSASILPVEVVVSQESVDDDQLEQQVLSGLLSAPEAVDQEGQN